MKKLTEEEAKRLCGGLDYALRRVRSGDALGLCNGIVNAHKTGKIRLIERAYLLTWIQSMLESHSWLEDYIKTCNSISDADRRYNLREPWVEWMKKHLMETSK